MSTEPPELEDEVRDLVRRVVTSMFDGTPAPTTPSPTTAPVAEAPADDPPTTTAIAIGADHGGYQLKERLAFKLREAGHQVDDCGTDGPDSVDYPEFAHAVASRVADGRCRWGIVVDGAGIGSAMVANKVPGVRAALCYDLSTARNSREHNHANVLTLGAGLVGPALAWQIVEEWLRVPWGGERHARRVEMIKDIEHRYAGAPS